MKLLIKNNFHIFDFTNSLNEFDLEIKCMDFSFLKNSIALRANIVLAFEDPSSINIDDINPDKSLFIKSESPKFVFISARNKKKFAQIDTGPRLDYQEMCQYFGL